MIRARILAGLYELALTLGVSVPVFGALVLWTDASVWVAVWVWLSTALLLAPVILMTRATIVRHPAPDHRRTGLQLSGQGCQLCRLMRFYLPLSVAPLGLAATSAFDATWPMIVGLGIAGLHLGQGLWALNSGREPHWTNATGVQFIQA